jgi:hypothetical protein
LSSGDDRRADHPPSVVRTAADWLVSLQGRDGSLGVSATLPSPGWSTPHGILLWAAVGEYQPQRERAAQWLLDQEGVSIPNLAPSERTVGHDTMIVGWPWVAGTHSWLEPTALAILALRRQGKSAHPRVGEGLRLISDRAIAAGGWNYGNKIAFGRDLRPQPAPTGLALLALAGLDVHPEMVAPALAYLLETLPGTRAPQSLGWGVLGLRAWARCPEAAEDWLAEAFAMTSRRGDASPGPAYLLLAAGEHSLELLGLRSEQENCLEA